MASGREAVVAIARQTAEGTPQAVPSFEVPMGSGRVAPSRTIETLPWTSDTQDEIGHYVSLIGGDADFAVPLLPNSCPAFLKPVIGSITTTGAAAPYSHVLTPADVLPWETLFYRQPGGNYHILEDAKGGSFRIGWSPGAPLELAFTGMGKKVRRQAAKWAAATLVDAVLPFFTYIGANMKFDLGVTPAVTRVRNLRGGSVSLNRNLDAIQTDGASYQYINEQTRGVEVSLDDVVFENNDVINSVFYGSAAGTDVNPNPVYGSADFTFLGSDQAPATTRSLRIELPSVLWNVTEVPGADPGGGTTAYSVTGSVRKIAGQPVIRITVINENAGTLY